MKPFILLLQESGIAAARFFSKLFNPADVSHPRIVTSRNFHFISLCIYMLGNYACVKEVPVADRHWRQHHEETDVYVAGKAKNATSTTANLDAAVYWENGNIIPLTDGTVSSEALAIAADRHNVYIAGYIGDQAAFWRNGHYVPLTDGKAPSRANGIFLYDHNVYVAGAEGKMAKYWRNGTSMTLGEGVVNSIFVERNNVYAAGLNAHSEAGYWKNGHWIPLTDPNSKSITPTSIFVEGYNVYVAGGVVVGDYGVTRATYWKNGNPVRLEDSMQSGSFANAIAVSRNHIYICGWALPGDHPNGQLWSNEASSLLNFSIANSIDVSGNDIYMAGLESDFHFLYQAILWKNGDLTILPGLPGALITQAEANSVFVYKSENGDGHELKHFQDGGRFEL